MAGSKKGTKKDVEFTVKKGERIPRKPLGDYSEANSLGEAVSRDGFLGTAMDDKNQYGPISMMILLLIGHLTTIIMYMREKVHPLICIGLQVFKTVIISILKML